MDVAGAEALRQRIEENEAAGRPSERRADDAMLLARLARPDIFDDLDDEDEEVTVRPALRQWLEHHNRTAGAAYAPVGLNANGGGAGALSRRISDQSSSSSSSSSSIVRRHPSTPPSTARPTQPRAPPRPFRPR